MGGDVCSQEWHDFVPGEEESKPCVSYTVMGVYISKSKVLYVFEWHCAVPVRLIMIAFLRGRAADPCRALAVHALFEFEF